MVWWSTSNFFGLLRECGKNQWDCGIVNYYVANTLLTSCNAQRCRIILQLSICTITWTGNKDRGRVGWLECFFQLRKARLHTYALPSPLSSSDGLTKAAKTWSRLIGWWRRRLVHSQLAGKAYKDSDYTVVITLEKILS